jgi:hypothetical protein
MNQEKENNENVENNKVVGKKGRPRKDPAKHSKDKDEAQKYQKEYYAKNKDKILNDLKTKVQCKYCQRTVSKCNLAKHEESNLCQKKRDKVIDLMKDLKRISEFMNISGDGYDKFIEKYSKK